MISFIGMMDLDGFVGPRKGPFVLFIVFDRELGCAWAFLLLVQFRGVGECASCVGWSGGAEESCARGGGFE